MPKAKKNPMKSAENVLKRAISFRTRLTNMVVYSHDVTLPSRK